jgi:hypothetical protein
MRLLFMPPLLLAGFQVGGMAGLIVGLGASEFVRYMFYVLLVRDQWLTVLLNDIPLSLLITSLSLVSADVGSMAGEQAPRFARFALEAGFVVTAWAVVFVVWKFGGRYVFGEFTSREHTEEAGP